MEAAGGAVAKKKRRPSDDMDQQDDEAAADGGADGGADDGAAQAETPTDVAAQLKRLASKKRAERRDAAKKPQRVADVGRHADRIAACLVTLETGDSRHD